LKKQNLENEMNFNEKSRLFSDSVITQTNAPNNRKNYSSAEESKEKVTFCLSF
jgi:hypothetical protein